MATDAITDLISALIAHVRRIPDDWASFSMVLSFPGGQFGGTSGYAYSADGSISAIASRPSAVEPAVEAYMAEHYGPGQTMPVAVLIQFDRSKGEYEATFEDTDASRWKVTPANIDEFREKLRPRFD